MTSKRAVLRAKRLERRKREVIIKEMQSYIDWCKARVIVRDENGKETVPTTQEALEFIVLTSQQADK